LNFFGLNASQPLAVVAGEGLDLRRRPAAGWFQWYCRYYLGPALRRRRAPDRALARYAPPRRTGPKETARKGDLALPTQAAPGVASLGV